MPVSHEAPKRPPLLFFKIGVLGAAEQGFGEALGQEFQAPVFSTGQIQEAIRQRNAASNMPVRGRRIPQYLFGQALPILRGGDDVVADMFFNTPRRRAYTPLKLAEKTGALAVALNLQTPSQLVRQRVEEWMAAGRLNMSQMERGLHPLAIVNRDRKSLIVPQPDENIDFVFDLDGQANLDGLVAQVNDHLDHHGLRH